MKFLLRNRANEIGFHLFGVADINDIALAPQAQRYEKWLENGHGASMEYLKRHAAKKTDPRLLLPEAKSIVMLGAVYSTEERPANRVSNYAQSYDYHVILREKIQELTGTLTDPETGTSFQNYIFVDAQPVFERFWAWRAGLGWIGKNTCAINKKAGSYFFLGGFLTDCPLVPDAPATDHCGRCTKCIEACPTQALVQPHILDANLCIAYHTIENRGDVPEFVRSHTEGWIAGCDICQQVCPWNDPPLETSFFREENPFSKLVREQSGDPTSAELKNLDPETYKSLVKDTALERMKFDQFQRNLRLHDSTGGENHSHDF